MSLIGDCLHPRVKQIISSKPVVGTIGAVGVAIIILSGLVILGKLYPSSALGILGDTFSQSRTFWLIVGGIAVLATAAVIRCKCQNNVFAQIPSDHKTSGFTIIRLKETEEETEEETERKERKPKQRHKSYDDAISELEKDNPFKGDSSPGNDLRLTDRFNPEDFADDKKQFVFTEDYVGWRQPDL